MGAAPAWVCASCESSQLKDEDRPAPQREDDRAEVEVATASPATTDSSQEGSQVDEGKNSRRISARSRPNSGKRTSKTTSRPPPWRWNKLSRSNSSLDSTSTHDSKNSTHDSVQHTRSSASSEEPSSPGPVLDNMELATDGSGADDVSSLTNSQMRPALYLTFKVDGERTLVEFLKGPVGLKFQHQSEISYAVSEIVPNSQAEAMGVRPGWELIEIRGNSIRGMGWDEVMQLLLQSSACLPRD